MGDPFPELGPYKEDKLSRLCRDMTGRRYGMLVVTGRSHQDKQTQAWWMNVHCDCGKDATLLQRNLRTMKSCGCSDKEFPNARPKPPETGRVSGIMEMMEKYRKDTGYIPGDSPSLRRFYG